MKNAIVMVFLSLALVACAVKPATVPSTAGVRDDVETTQREVRKAQAATVRAGQLSDSMRHGLDQADRKNVLMKRWIELQ